MRLIDLIKGLWTACAQRARELLVGSASGGRLLRFLASVLPLVFGGLTLVRTLAGLGSTTFPAGLPPRVSPTLTATDADDPAEMPIPSLRRLPQRELSPAHQPTDLEPRAASTRTLPPSLAREAALLRQLLAAVSDNRREDAITLYLQHRRAYRHSPRAGIREKAMIDLHCRANDPTEAWHHAQRHASALRREGNDQLIDTPCLMLQRE